MSVWVSEVEGCNGRENAPLLRLLWYDRHVRFSIAGSPSRGASLALSRLAVATVCGCVFGAGNSCNVYTSDMLVSAVGGSPMLTGGQPSSGGSGHGGMASGGLGLGGEVSGGGTVPQTLGGATAYGGDAATGGSVDAGGTSSPPAGGGAAGEAPISTGGLATGGAGVVTNGGGGGVAVATGGSPTYGGGGAAGAPSTGGSPVIPCDPEVVDDMRDVNAAIDVCAGRNGTWYTFGADPSLVPLPYPKGTFSKTLVSAADEAIIKSKYVAKLQGNSTQDGDCGMGFTLNVLSNGTKIAYSLAGKKLVFKYRTTAIANGYLSLAIPLKTTVPATEGGTCTGTCYNHYAIQLDSTNGQWSATMTIPLVRGDGRTTGFAQNTNWGVNLVDWDPTLALMVQFTVTGLSAQYAIEVASLKLLAL